MGKEQVQIVDRRRNERWRNGEPANPGIVIYEQDTLANPYSYYRVEQGMVGLYKTAHTGKVIIPEVLKAGAIFGYEDSLVDKIPDYSFTAKTLAHQTIVTRLPIDLSDGGTVEKLAKDFSVRLRRKEKEVVFMRDAMERQKVAYGILDLLEGDVLRNTVNTVAARAGTTRKAAGKVINTFVNKGILDRVENSLVVQQEKKAILRKLIGQ